MSSLYSLKRLSAVERIRFDSLVIEFGQEFALERKTKSRRDPLAAPEEA